MQNKKRFYIIFISVFSLLICVFICIQSLKAQQSSKQSSKQSLATLIDLLTPPEINTGNFPNFQKAYGIDPQIQKLKEILDRFKNEKNYKIKKNKEDKSRYMSSDPDKNEPTALPKGVIFYGPPGTGKTFTAKCCVTEVDNEMNFYTITPADTIDTIQDIFKKARKNAPSIVFADEAEEVVKTKNGSVQLEPGDAKKTNLILAELDGVKTDEENPIFFIASTNYIDKIDEAIKSRLESIYFGYFSKEQRLGFLKTMLSKHNYSIHPSAYKHLEIIVEQFNEAVDNPEKITAEIIQKQRYIPAIGTTEDKGKNKTSDDLLQEHNLKEKYKQIDEIPSLEDVKTKYQIDKDKYFVFLKTLDKVKKHFYDIQSGRKLEMLITTAANKAGFYSSSRDNKLIKNTILSSDLDESLAEYIGTKII